MGVVFFLVFALICIAIGIIPLIAGIVILVRRASQKKKTGKKYRKRLIGGIVLTGFGAVFAGLPILYIVGILSLNVLMMPLDWFDAMMTVREEAYFDKYVKTGTMVALQGDNDGEWEFTLDGRRYVYIPGMKVEYKDKRRGDAIANIKVSDDVLEGYINKTLTLFEYTTDFSDGLLCLRDCVYCKDEELNKLEDYYSQEKFQYTCEYVDKHDESHDFKTDFADEVFFDVVQTAKGKFEKCSDEEFWEAIDEDVEGYTLEQTSEDGLFRCDFGIYVSGQEVFICGIDPLYSENENIQNENYRITDEELVQEFLLLDKEVRKRQKG